MDCAGHLWQELREAEESCCGGAEGEDHEPMVKQACVDYLWDIASGAYLQIFAASLKNLTLEL